MNSPDIPSCNLPASTSEPLWVTSSFSTKELDGRRVRIDWIRDGTVMSWGIYQIHMGSYGHSRHIQSIHAVLVEDDGCDIKAFDFDQTDADLLHRSNENLRRYDLVARLDRDRRREQSPHLEKLVHERRQRKAGDLEGGDRWQPQATLVLKTVPAPTGGYQTEGAETSHGVDFPGRVS
jgi:hypothetical protein